VQQRIALTNDFKQAGERYRSLSKVDQEHLVDNIVDSLGKAERPIQQRMIENLTKADPEFGGRVSKGLRI
jgi:catalase